MILICNFALICRSIVIVECLDKGFETSASWPHPQTTQCIRERIGNVCARLFQLKIHVYYKQYLFCNALPVLFPILDEIMSFQIISLFYHKLGSV